MWIVFVMSLIISWVAVGVLFYEMIEKNSIENALHFKQDISTRKSMKI
ncbi:hypothetical protein M948_14560 [Virgibacillus sp. CM-4]|nr:hypothetical protein M948_14560 [Virgibacillus sp. CM-4]